jgi:DNA-binding winged helix-turn-helix (wHTH) protein
LLLERRFLVDGWLVDPLANRMTKAGASRQLEPKIMQVLAYLAASAGETVRREALVRDVWGATYISDEALSRCVSVLRASFADDPQHAHVIETVSKVGYRLIAPIQLDDDHQNSRLAVIRPPPTQSGWLTASASVAYSGALSEEEWEAAVRLLKQHFGAIGSSYRDETGALWQSQRGPKTLRLEAQIVRAAADHRSILRIEYRDRSLVLSLLPAPIVLLLVGFALVGHTLLASTVLSLSFGAGTVAFFFGRGQMLRQLRRRRREVAGLLTMVANLVDQVPTRKAK